MLLIKVVEGELELRCNSGLREHMEEETFELGVEGQAAAPGKSMNNSFGEGVVC